MQMKRNRVVSVLMALALSAGLMGCAVRQPKTTGTTQPTPGAFQGEAVRRAVLSGPPGHGAA